MGTGPGPALPLPRDRPRDTAARRRPWSPRIWAWIAGTTLAVHLALTLLFPQRDRWIETCAVCASRQDRSEVRGAWGLLTLDRTTGTTESWLVVDGLVPADHVHRWVMLSHSSHGLLGGLEADGAIRCSRFALAYASEAEFRHEVRARLTDGSLGMEQVRHELEQDWSDPNDPDRAAIARVLEEFDRPPGRVR